MVRTQTARFEFRIHAEMKARIEEAAALIHESASDFARAAVLDRAEAVLRRQETTLVPSDFFETLLAELGASDEPNARLAAAARRARIAHDLV